LIEVSLPGRYNTAIECCEKYISPRQYWLHNRVGGAGWEVTHSSAGGFRSVLKVNNDLIATFIMLKLK
jgi:hypothetical protein